MIFVRKAENNNWTIDKPETKDPVQEVQLEEEVISDEYAVTCDDITEDDDQLLTEIIEVQKHEIEPIKLAITPPVPKRQKLSAGLPDSIRYTSYELEKNDKNVITLNIATETMLRPKNSNYTFDSSFAHHHDESCVYQCKYCIKAFSNSEFLLKHTLHIHLCTICLEVSPTYKSSQIHSKMHKAISCPFCFKDCESPASYRQHLKKQHLLQIPLHIGILPLAQ